MLLVDVIGGQDRRNKEMLLEEGLAFNLDHANELVSLLHRFMNDGFDRNHWRKRIADLSRPNSSREIASKIVSLVGEKGEMK